MARNRSVSNFTEVEVGRVAHIGYLAVWASPAVLKRYLASLPLEGHSRRFSRFLGKAKLLATTLPHSLIDRRPILESTVKKLSRARSASKKDLAATLAWILHMECGQ